MAERVVAQLLLRCLEPGAVLRRVGEQPAAAPEITNRIRMRESTIPVVRGYPTDLGCSMPDFGAFGLKGFPHLLL